MHTFVSQLCSHNTVLSICTYLCGGSCTQCMYLSLWGFLYTVHVPISVGVLVHSACTYLCGGSCTQCMYLSLWGFLYTVHVPISVGVLYTVHVPISVGVLYTVHVPISVGVLYTVHVPISVGVLAHSACTYLCGGSCTQCMYLSLWGSCTMYIT